MIVNIIKLNISIHKRQLPPIQVYFSQENHCEKKAANIQHKETLTHVSLLICDLL